jgi:hypothetical protein
MPVKIFLIFYFSIEQKTKRLLMKIELTTGLQSIMKYGYPQEIVCYEGLQKSMVHCGKILGKRDHHETFKMEERR